MAGVGLLALCPDLGTGGSPPSATRRRAAAPGGYPVAATLLRWAARTNVAAAATLRTTSPRSTRVYVPVAVRAAPAAGAKVVAAVVTTVSNPAKGRVAGGAERAGEQRWPTRRG